MSDSLIFFLLLGRLLEGCWNNPFSLPTWTLRKGTRSALLPSLNLRWMAFISNGGDPFAV